MRLSRMRTLMLMAIVIVGTTFGAHSASADENTPALNVFVSIAPQAYFVEQIAGELIGTSVLIPPGHSPATYEMTPRQYAALIDADIYFRIGVPAEDRIVAKLQSVGDGPVVIDTRHGIMLRTMDRSTDGHGHDHGRADPHVWLDPDLVKVQATTIAESLAVRLPDRESFLDSSLAAFHAELDRLDSMLTLTLATVKGKNMYVFHPSFGYFTDAYGLNQVPIEAGGKEPEAKHLGTLIEKAKKESVKAIFVQPQFSDKGAKIIAEEIGAKLVVLDPLSGNYINNMRSIGLAVVQMLYRETTKQ